MNRYCIFRIQMKSQARIWKNLWWHQILSSIRSLMKGPQNRLNYSRDNAPTLWKSPILKKSTRH